MSIMRMLFVFGLGYYLGHNNITPHNIFNNNNENVQKGNSNINDDGIEILGIPLVTFERDNNGKVPSFKLFNTLRIGIVK